MDDNYLTPHTTRKWISNSNPWYQLTSCCHPHQQGCQHVNRNMKVLYMICSPVTTNIPVTTRRRQRAQIAYICAQQSRTTDSVRTSYQRTSSMYA